MIFGDGAGREVLRIEFPLAFCYVVHIRSKYFLQNPVLEHSRLVFLPNVSDQFLHIQICNSLS